MSEIKRNQFFLSKNHGLALGDNCLKVSAGEYCLYYHNNLPIIVSDEIVFLGWAWCCATGTVIDSKFVSKLSEENALSKLENVSGRYVVILNGRLLITDATSSFSIYYCDQVVSSSLAIIAEIKGVTLKADPCFSNKLYLGPACEVNGVKRLIPGEYLDLVSLSPEVINDFLYSEVSDITLLERLSQLSDLLSKSAIGLRAVTQNNARLMLTGGKDSRLSLVSAVLTGWRIKAFTHLKPRFMNDPNDINVPKELAKRLGLDFIFTEPKVNKLRLSSLSKHSPFMAEEQAPGSTAYYYRNGNWKQVKEEYLIDNYYEIGRMHMHGKGVFRFSNNLSLEIIQKAGMVVTEKSYERLEYVMTNISGSVNSLDVFYFIKNYTNVANQFGLIDYSHNPLTFCNSRSLFKALLAVPESYRSNGYFHKMLLNVMSPIEVSDIPCNPNSASLSSKFLRKIRITYMKIKFKLKGKK